MDRVGSEVRTTVVEFGEELVLLGFAGSEVAGASVPDFVVRTVRVGSDVPSEIDTTTDAESTFDLLSCEGAVPDLVVVEVVLAVVPSLAGVVVDDP